MRSSIRGWCAARQIAAARKVIFQAVIAAGAGTFVAACNDDLVEDVPTDICASGKRWVGELTPDEEMYPGQDCMSCHQALDGPSFIAAGTVYGVADPDGTRTVNPFCFGVEGARVTITGADGAVLRTLTNRAGNFFFDGPKDALAMPFSVELELTLSNGRVTRQPMATLPSYGGCAHCHDPKVPPTPGVLPGTMPAPGDVIEGTYPIWTGPLYE
jgi:hypothetical protein